MDNEEIFMHTEPKTMRDVHAAQAGALRLFLAGYSLEEISETTAIPITRLQYWKGKLKWQALQDEILAERIKEAKRIIMVQQVDHAPKAVKREFDLAQAIEERAQLLLEGAPDAEDLSRLSNSLKSTRGVISDLLGLDKKSSGTEGSVNVMVNMSLEPTGFSVKAVTDDAVEAEFEEAAPASKQLPWPESVTSGPF